MQTMTYSKLRQTLAGTLDRVNDDASPFLISRQNGKDAVLLSYDDYRSLEETIYLLSNPANAEHLSRSIEELERGKGKRRALLK